MINVRLEFQPPLDWRQLLEFLQARATDGIEAVRGQAYRRYVAMGRGFDLDARPEVIAAHLENDPELGPQAKAHPGLRVPGAFAPFELAIRTVLGQQVTIAAANRLCGRLVEAFGSVGEGAGWGDSVAGICGRVFPTPGVLASAAVDEVRSIGMPESRARTIVDLSRAVADGRLGLRGINPETVEADLRAIRGIGPWTAQYTLMRAVKWPDAFPAGDLGIRKALGARTAREAEECARPWRPWRAYAAFHLWTGLAGRTG